MKKLILINFAILALQLLNTSLNAQVASITCPGSITVSTTPGYCTRVVNNIDPVVVPSNATLSYTISGPLSGNYAGSASGISFPAGVSTITYSLPDYPGVTCSFTVTVVDNESPVITCPLNLNLTCEKDVPPLYLSITTAVDNCSGQVEAKFLSETRVNETCINRFTLIRTFKATDDAGNTSTCAQIITVNDNEAPHFLQPQPVSPLTVSCSNDVLVANPGNYTAYDNCSDELTEDIIAQFKQVKSDSTCPNKYTLTRTWTAKDACGNQAVYTQVIYVDDKQAPEFNGFPPSLISVSSAKDIPPPVPLEATDYCGGTPIITISEVKSNVECANRFTLTRTYIATDACGNTSTRTSTIIVNDRQPPTLSSVSVSSAVLWPPNHKMKDITVNYTATDNSEVTTTLDVTSNESITGGSDGDLAPDWEIVDEHHLKLRAEKSNNGQARYYSIKTTASDGCNDPVVETVIVAVAHNITGPQTGNPFKVGSTVPFNGVFWDKPGNKHTAKWLLDGSSVVNGTVTEPSGNQNGKVTGSYKFNSPGIYKLQMNVTDQAGVTSYANTNNDLDAIVVVYDPNGGNTYGGGYFDSPAGALRSDAAAKGKASYGFAMNYFKNSTNPKGEAQFEFKVGDFEFNALNFDYLVINNSMAQFKGTGKIIGGQSGIGFTMTVTDGQLDGSGVDKIRMKIYNKNHGAIIYDNQPGASDAALPVQAVGTNSTVVIGGSNPNADLTSANTNQKAEMEAKIGEASNGFEVNAFPNPSLGSFSLNIKTGTTTEKITMQVIDMFGRVIETRNVNASSSIRFGDRYNAGTYFVKIIQGKEHRELKLIKLSN